LGVYEVLRRREAAKLAAARRRGGSAEARRLQLARHGPGRGGPLDVALFANADHCSFAPDITRKGRSAPPRTTAAMSADGAAQVASRQALTLRTEKVTLAGATFAPTLAARRSKATAKVAAQGGGALRIMDTGATPPPGSGVVSGSGVVVGGGGGYIERLRAKAAAQDAARRAELAARADADVAQCTFAPDLPACPGFILRLAEGFRAVNAKQRQALYGQSSLGHNSGDGVGQIAAGVQPPWQTVGAAEGTVFGARWHGVVVTDPGLQLKRMPRGVSTGSSSVKISVASPGSFGASASRSASSFEHGAFA